MTTNAVYIPGQGVLVTITGTEGLSVLIRDDMSVAAMENYIHELIDWLS